MSGNKQQQQQVTSSSSSATSTAPTVSGSPSSNMNPSSGQDKSSAAYDYLFDSGYSATAMSLNSSSDVHQSQQQLSEFGGKKGNVPSTFPAKGVEIDPSGDSGLCIDSGLSIDCSSPDIEKTTISFPRQQQPVLSGLNKQLGQCQQQTIRLQSSSTTLPSTTTHSSSSPVGRANYIDPNYECFINNAFAQDEEGDT